MSLSRELYGYLLRDWVGLLLALMVGCLTGLLAWKRVRTQLSITFVTPIKEFAITKLASFDWRAFTKVTFRRLRTTSSLVVAFAVGYYARELSQFNRTYVIHDAYIVKQLAPSRFLMQIPSGLPFVAIFCRDSETSAWENGIKLSVLVYEDRGRCWSIADKRLGWTAVRNRQGLMVHFAEMEDGQSNIQMGDLADRSGKRLSDFPTRSVRGK